MGVRTPIVASGNKGALVVDANLIDLVRVEGHHGRLRKGKRVNS
jgi:hypothetical protein